ncbi:TPA: phosphopantothenate/pantothenate synthetase [Candidatus Woesearchaeota archaeon]|nr:phosphopantothenate/pantothenate synthetase [Candidatus Woesearchaeota archaeon]HII68867.1 phosphopantothenate/pantothenate synthetase [Candidatus Woesearchaeota archaeon]
MAVPTSHPRYISLATRELIAAGVEAGITSIHGLIAHGRGEAFDYLLGEKTHPFAKDAIRTAAALLLAANHPVLSVNGNAAALVPKELVRLSVILGAPLEVNIFHSSKKRERKIAAFLKKNGAKEVLLPSAALIKGIRHNRRLCNPSGIAKADVVFVPLEDGDRCGALVAMGKRVVTIDLNPLSRTSRMATVSIVDNVVRAMPLLIREIEGMKKKSRSRHQTRLLVKDHANKAILKKAISRMRSGNSSC